MRFMVLIKADPNAETGLPGVEAISHMVDYNKKLVKAGVLLDAARLRPSSQGARVRFAPDRVTVVDGPFAESKELIGGYEILEVTSKEEAIEWVRRMPNPYGQDGVGEVELRPLYEVEDFAAILAAGALPSRGGDKP